MAFIVVSFLIVCLALAISRAVASRRPVSTLPLGTNAEERGSDTTAGDELARLKLREGGLYAPPPLAIAFGVSPSALHTSLGEEFLLESDGAFVSAFFDSAFHPSAPDVVLPGSSADAQRRARAFAAQRQFIPVFLWRGTQMWQYLGDYRVSRISEDPADIQRFRTRSRQSNSSVVLWLEPASREWHGEPPWSGAELPQLITHSEFATLALKDVVPGATIETEGSDDWYDHLTSLWIKGHRVQRERIAGAGINRLAEDPDIILEAWVGFGNDPVAATHAAALLSRIGLPPLTVGMSDDQVTALLGSTFEHSGYWDIYRLDFTVGTVDQYLVSCLFDVKGERPESVEGWLSSVEIFPLTRTRRSFGKPPLGGDSP